MKYAIVKTGGKQYKISEGDVLEVERLALEDKKEITLDEVLLYTSDGVVRVGTPNVAGVSIQATVLGDIRGKKIYVSKFKAKVRYRRTIGHRQALTKIKIDRIEAKDKVEKAKSITEKTMSTKDADSKKAIK